MSRSSSEYRNLGLQTGDLVFSSRVPEMIFQHMGEERKYHILDLGPPTQENVTLFSKPNVKFYIDDLRGNLSSSRPDLEFGVSSLRALKFSATELSQLLPYSPDTRFDVILLWDLLNYFNETSIEALISHLGQFCRRGALLYFLTSTHREMPTRPARMYFQNKNQVKYSSQSPIEECSPRYSPKHLEQIMSGFTISRLYLLANGLQEHLFRFEKPLDHPNLTILG